MRTHLGQVQLAMSFPLHVSGMCTLQTDEVTDQKGQNRKPTNLIMSVWECQDLLLSHHAAPYLMHTP